MSRSTEWRVDVGTETTSVRYDPAPAGESAVFVCGHGAGGNMNDRAMQGVTNAMLAAGLGVVRFNFLYTEKNVKRPQPMPQLQQCFTAVAERARAELVPKRMLIGGRSLGGRTGSMLAADGFDADGLLLLAYPLHPPGQTDKLRDAHLPSIAMPVLCFNGTRDEFCDVLLMKRVVQRAPASWTMHWLEGADHGFHVLKKSGRTDADVLGEVTAATRTWLAQRVR